MLPKTDKKLHGRCAGDENGNFNGYRRIDEPNRSNAIRRPLCACSRGCSDRTKLHCMFRQEALAYPGAIHLPKAQSHAEAINQRVERQFICNGVRLQKTELCWMERFDIQHREHEGFESKARPESV